MRGRRLEQDVEFLGGFLCVSSRRRHTRLSCDWSSDVCSSDLGSGWDVTVLDENEDSLGRLGESWTGGFVVGHGMDLQLLREAGIEEADAAIVTTDGDNTNLVIAQTAQKQFEVPTVVVRVLDPA